MAAIRLESTYLLGAIVEQKDTPQLRMAAYSRMQLAAFLEDNPAAMSMALPGAGNAERLLNLFLVGTDVFQPLLESHLKSDPWLLFAERADDQLRLEDTFNRNEQLIRFVQSVARQRTGQTIVMIRQTDHVRARFDALLDALRRVVGSPGSRAIRTAVVAKPELPDEASDREELIRICKEMLDRAGGTFNSEDLATAARSTTTNSSQLAADQRDSGRLFGVRWGREWRYPRFQFDSARCPYPEMKTILAALSPDKQGWDRLQWFLEPHESLGGRTPLEVWATDRRKVIKAASTERWSGRD